MVRMEAMIRHQNHGGAVTGFPQQFPQHLVVKLVCHRDYTMVQVEVAFADPWQLWRMVPHECMAEVIDGFVVDREEIPRLVVQQPGGRGMDAHAFRERPEEHGQAFIAILIDVFHEWNKGLHHPRLQTVGMHAQMGQRFGQFHRMHRIRRQGPALVKRPRRAVVLVGHHHAINGFGGMAGPPADHDAAQIVLVENVPQRLRRPCKVGDWPNAASIGRRLDKAVYAMLVRPLSSGDGSPQHGRERRMQRGNRSRGAIPDEALDIGHFSGVHEGMDDLPVGGIPADQEDLGRGD